MAAAELEIKSPSVRLLQRGISLYAVQPLFGKACPEPSRREGKGRFFERNEQALEA
jgi:hypothetical protein